MLQDLRNILSMIRFSHTIFALPFALLAAVMAWSAGVPESWQGAPLGFRFRALLGILICMICARSAAMAFNRIVDRDFDSANPRTQSRHLPSGTLSLKSVWWFTAMNSLIFVAATLLFLPNVLPIVLSLPVLVFLFAYSYTKRFTAGAHFWLGAALMMAPISTWIALRGELVLQSPLDLLPAVWLGAAVLWWVAGFDIIYSCQDAEHDVQAKLRSVPAKLGVPLALRVAATCHFVMILFLSTLPTLSHFGGPPLQLGVIYWVAVAAVAVLLAYEHSLVRPDDLTRVNVAFFQVNAIVSIGLFLVTTLDLLL
jgi:4-hydroxybenzoate polyprenyltransferase